MMQAGEKMPGLLMHIIRYVLPEQDHTIKKLLFVFWEIVPKRDAAGKLLTEMILVCDAYRKVNISLVSHLIFREQCRPKLTILSVPHLHKCNISFLVIRGIRH